MATLTDLHRNTKVTVQRALIDRKIEITSHGRVQAVLHGVRPRQKMTKEQVLSAIRACPLRLETSWEELRTWTRS